MSKTQKRTLTAKEASITHIDSHSSHQPLVPIGWLPQFGPFTMRLEHGDREGIAKVCRVCNANAIIILLDSYRVQNVGTLGRITNLLHDSTDC